MALVLDGSNGITFPSGNTQSNVGILTTGGTLSGGLSFAGAANGQNAQYAPSKVLQVVSSYYNTSVSTTSATPQASGLTATITPIFATSKILIIATMGDLATNASGVGVKTFLYKNGSQLTQTTNNALYATAAGNFVIGNGPATNYLDSPATTSAVTYAMYFATQVAGNTATVNRDSTASSITLMEIAQ